MESPGTDSREVPVDVLPPVPVDADIRSTEEISPAPLAGLKTFYHPASGMAILGVDLLCFGPEAIFPPDMVFLCPLAFLVSFVCVYFFQLKWSKNTPAAAFGKAFLGAFLAGIPYSITGTIFGAAVLALSGLPRNPVEAYKKITSRGLKLTP
jgi:hypothetical protein